MLVYGACATKTKPARAESGKVSSRFLKSRALREPDARGRLYSIGAEPMSNTPEEFAADINAEMVKWSKVIKAAGIRVD